MFQEKTQRIFHHIRDLLLESCESWGSRKHQITSILIQFIKEDHSTPEDEDGWQTMSLLEAIFKSDLRQEGVSAGLRMILRETAEQLESTQCAEQWYLLRIFEEFAYVSRVTHPSQRDEIPDFDVSDIDDDNLFYHALNGAYDLLLGYRKDLSVPPNEVSINLCDGKEQRQSSETP